MFWLTTYATIPWIIRRGLKISSGKPFEGILPVRLLQLLDRIARGNTTVAASNEHLRFSLPGEVMLYVHLTQGKYSDLAAVIPSEFTGSAILDREELLMLVKAAVPFTDGDTHLAMLETGDDRRMR